MNGIKKFKHMALLLTLIVLVAGCQGNGTTDGDKTSGTEVTQGVQENQETQDGKEAQSDQDIQDDEEEQSDQDIQDDEEVQSDQDQATDSGTEEAEGYSFVDVFDNTIALETLPTSYISFAPEITEILYAIGAGDGLIGRSTYGNYPEAALEVEEVGTLSDFNMERVVELNPDVVFISSLASEENYQQLVDAGLTPVALSYGNTLAGTMDYVKQVAEITGYEVEAESVITSIDEAINGAKERAANRKPKSVYYILGAGESGDFAATGDTFIGQIIEVTGATNAAADGSNWMYNVEQVVEKNPDIIIGSNAYGLLDSLSELDGYKDLTAVKEGRVYNVNDDMFNRQGPRVVDAIKEVERIVYGDE